MSKKKIFIIIGVVILFIVISVIVGVSSCNNNDLDSTNDFVIQDTLKDGENQKVKVFLLAGQSNASGCSYISELKNNISNEEFLKYENGYNNIYINYFDENGANRSDGFTNVKLGQGANTSLFGPELGMAEKLNELYPSETIFIIKYAWGGTNLHDLWKAKNGPLYKAFIKFVHVSMEYLENKNYDADIIAMMWMQGEADSDAINSKKYETNLKDFINSVRNELDSYIEEEMYFIDAYISDSIYWKHYSIINDAKQNVCDTSSYNICIDTIKEGLSYSNEPIGSPDLAHYDSLSEIKLGNLFIQALLIL